MDWLTSDLQLLEADAAQLRQHLGWLLEDLRARGEGLDGREATLAACVADVEDCLARVARLDALLDQLRAALAAT